MKDWIPGKKSHITSSAGSKAVTVSVTLPPTSPVRREGLSYYSFMGRGPTSSVRTTWDLVAILPLWSLPQTYWVRTQILARFLDGYMNIIVWATLIWAMTMAHSGKEAYSSALAIPIYHSEDRKNSEPWSIKPPLFFALEAIVFWRGKEITVSLRILGSSPPEDSSISDYARADGQVAKIHSQFTVKWYLKMLQTLKSPQSPMLWATAGFSFVAILLSKIARGGKQYVSGLLEVPQVPLLFTKAQTLPSLPPFASAFLLMSHLHGLSLLPCILKLAEWLWTNYVEMLRCYPVLPISWPSLGWLFWSTLFYWVGKTEYLPR